LTENNKKKMAGLTRLIEQTFKRVLKKGFYGMARFSVSIQDGSIQDIEKEEIEKTKIS
jgi:hypothetical protein